MEIQASPTPNPNAIKFRVGVTLVPSGSRTFDSAEEAVGDPLARRLFLEAGVRSVFVLGTFVTVTRQPGVEWDDLVPRIERALREHLGAA
jgi:hypothetical protein